MNTSVIDQVERAGRSIVFQVPFDEGDIAELLTPCPRSPKGKWDEVDGRELSADRAMRTVIAFRRNRFPKLARSAASADAILQLDR